MPLSVSTISTLDGLQGRKLNSKSKNNGIVDFKNKLELAEAVFHHGLAYPAQANEAAELAAHLGEDDRVR